MKIGFLLVVVATVLVSVGAARAQDAGAASPEAADSLALARQYTQWLYSGAADSLDARLSERYRTGDAERPDFARLTRTILERGGVETGVIEETWKLRNGRCQYWRVARFVNMDEPVVVRWVLDRAGRIDGIGVGPLSQTPPVESDTCATT